MVDVLPVVVDVVVVVVVDVVVVLVVDVVVVVDVIISLKSGLSVLPEQQQNILL